MRCFTGCHYTNRQFDYLLKYELPYPCQLHYKAIANPSKPNKPAPITGAPVCTAKPEDALPPAAVMALAVDDTIARVDPVVPPVAAALFVLAAPTTVVAIVVVV